MGGYPLAHAMMLMIPEAWAGNPLMDEDRRAFYEYHAALMEPWDGPAAMAFTDGRQIGATLDRNGLRPARFIVTDDDYVVMASEVGVLDIPERKIVKKWRLQPGKMLLVDTRAGPHHRRRRAEAHARDARSRTASGSSASRIALDDAARARAAAAVRGAAARSPAGVRLHAGGPEDHPRADGARRRGGRSARWATTRALPVLSDRPKVLYNYFKQLFAQVTNPPIDPIREELVMSLVTFIGPRPNLLGIDETDPPMRLEAQQPILTADAMEKIRHIALFTGGAFKRLRARHLLSGGVGRATAWRRRSRRSCARRRGRDPPRLQHPHPVRPQGVGRRCCRSRRCSRRPPCTSIWCARACARSTGLVVETGSAREVHHFALLAGYGAEAIHPYLALETLAALRGRRARRSSPQEVGEALHQGDLQGPVQGDVEDGHLDLPVLLRRADLRGGRPARASSSTSISPAPRATSRASACSRSPRRRRGCTRLAFGDDPLLRDALDAGGEYAVPRPRRGAHVDAGLDRQAAARDARRQLRDVQGIRGAHQRPDASGC